MHHLSFCFLLFIVVAGCDILTGNDGSMRLSGRVTAGGSSSRTPEAITAVNRAIAAGLDPIRAYTRLAEWLAQEGELGQVRSEIRGQGRSMAGRNPARIGCDPCGWVRHSKSLGTG